MINKDNCPHAEQCAEYCCKQCWMNVDLSKTTEIILVEFASKFINMQTPCPPEFLKIMDDNLDDLYADTSCDGQVIYNKNAISKIKLFEEK